MLGCYHLDVSNLGVTMYGGRYVTVFFIIDILSLEDTYTSACVCDHLSENLTCLHIFPFSLNIQTEYSKQGSKAHQNLGEGGHASPSGKFSCKCTQVLIKFLLFCYQIWNT